MPAARRSLTVSVRDLVEFVLRRGDLGGSGDFVGPRRALAGTRGHQRIQRSRPEGYEKELALAWDWDAGDFVLRIQGRIDGVLSTAEGTTIEEIKTVQAAWDGQADPLHWSQARFYGHMIARERGLLRLGLQLTYLNLDTGQITEFRIDASAPELEAFCRETAQAYADWIRDQFRWFEERNVSLRTLEFPFSPYRPGQRDLAIAAYKAMTRGGRLFLEAPTGIGKTISLLFPAAKALGEGKVERIFYLTARTSGRAVAEKALDDLRQAGARLRTVTLTAKEKICVREGQPCDPATCPLAQGYYDRFKPAMREAFREASITRPALEGLAQKHQVCPFELSLDVSSWADAVVCDYNYVFDPQVYLRRHFQETPADNVFLVDEAHNLVDRAREMFSAELAVNELQAVRRAVADPLPRCARSISWLTSAIRKLCSPASKTGLDEPWESPPGELELFSRTSSNRAPGPAAGSESDRKVLRQLPEQLAPLLEEALSQAEGWLARNEPSEFRQSLLELYFTLNSFRRTADLYDERFVTIGQAGRDARIRLYCVDPSFLLRQALARGKTAVFFSATLGPMDYYRTLLGGSPEDPDLRLLSPFPQEHLAVIVQPRIRTDLQSRALTLPAVVGAIGAAVESRRGNYLVYFPSYQYLDAVKDAFTLRFPQIATRAQSPGMTEPEREAFLSAFAAENPKTLVGFAVLGGVFGEGIDLVGERLVGAVIVGVGMPQLCLERDLIRDYFDEVNRQGFNYAYTFPGWNRVLQAAGRVIRSESDLGWVLLIDARFGERRYRELFPAWWQPNLVRNDAELAELLRMFPPPIKR